VVLPAPLGPTSATNCPGWMWNDTCSSAISRAWLIATGSPVLPSVFSPPESTAWTMSTCPCRSTLRSRCSSSMRYSKVTSSNVSAPRTSRRTRAPGFSAMSSGRSITSNTRSKLTIDVANATGALVRFCSAPYNCVRYEAKATIVPMVNAPFSTRCPPTQYTSAVPIAPTSPMITKNWLPVTARVMPMSRT